MCGSGCADENYVTTSRIRYTHRCPACQAYYIPYDSDICCPRCGLLEEQRIDYVELVAAAARANLEAGGSYLPAGWWNGSLGDHILFILFRLLEHHRLIPAGQSFEHMTWATLERSNWDEQAYLREHIYGIALRVYDELNNS
jgi:hypothetical protein